MNRLSLLALLLLTPTLGLADSLSDYYAKFPGKTQKTYGEMQSQFKQEQAANQGYVWTISVMSESEIKLEGLFETKYSLKGSLSHVGPTINGIFGGELSFRTEYDKSGLDQMMEALGGWVEIEQNGKEGPILMKCPEIYFDIHAYDPTENEAWLQNFTTGGWDYSMPDSTIQQTTALYSMLAGEVKPREKDFEHTMTPLSFGAITNTKIDQRYSQVDANISLNNGYYRIAAITESKTGGEIVDGVPTNGEFYRPPQQLLLLPGLLGKELMVWGETEIVINVLPLLIRIYPNNVVVFELYNSTGGPFVAKFYGVLDKIPVEDTMTATQAAAEKIVRRGVTDDRSDILEREAEKRRLAEEEAKAQAKAEADEKAAKEAEFKATWDEHLSLYPRWQAGGSNFELEDMDEGAWVLYLESEVDNTGAYIEQLLQAGFTSLDGDYGPWFKNVDGQYHGFTLDHNDGSFDENLKSVHVYFYEVNDADELKRIKEMEKKSKKTK